MARPQKTGLDYFPMDTGFFEDRKIRVISAKFGPAGVVAYLYFLCMLYKDKGYFLQSDEDFLLMAAQDIGVAMVEIENMLAFMLERRLFDATLYKREGVLSAQSIQQRYQAAKKGCKRMVRVSPAIWLLPPGSTESYIEARDEDCFSVKNGGYSGGKTNKEKERKKEKKERDDSRVTLGKNGWVVLETDDYEAIATQYGREETARAAAYVDELCQMNGNKYKWTDFGTVLCRALREGWGKQKQTGGLAYAQRNYDPSHFEKDLRESEEALDRMEDGRNSVV